MDTKTSSTSPSPPAQPRPVKKENEEEIKEFAETAMNELLGWYGYERLELRRWAASRARDASSPENATEHKDKDECSWCNKSITSDTGALQQAGATFCSEVCFSQSRRANFKRAKTCDWCRHVRHTVAYVDFQDGATQLQFCSDKCLNQYKMHIFCRETQAHLDLNPHLVNASSSSNLITPDLWMKNCRSRSMSPHSEHSGSSVQEPTKQPDKTEKKQKSPVPLITIAPTAKLMKPKRVSEEHNPIQKSPETKRDLRSKLNLRKRRSSKCSSTVTSQTLRQSTTPKAQDLRMCSPSTIDGSSPISTMGNSTVHSPTHPIQHQMPPHFPNPFGVPGPMFMENIPQMHEQRLPNVFPPRPNFMPRSSYMQERPRIPIPQFPHHLGQAPPVTVLVPYPVPLPIPLPIPIPIPMSAFLQASYVNKMKTEPRDEENEVPLDFTINSEKRKARVDSDSIPEASKSDDTLSETVDGNDRVEDASENVSETGNAEQTLPKFKITRLGNKMAKIVPKAKELPESTRPLRKRRRLVEVSADEESIVSKNRKIVQV